MFSSGHSLDINSQSIYQAISRVAREGWQVDHLHRQGIWGQGWLGTKLYLVHSVEGDRYRGGSAKTSFIALNIFRRIARFFGRYPETRLKNIARALSQSEDPKLKANLMVEDPGQPSRRILSILQDYAKIFIGAKSTLDKWAEEALAERKIEYDEWYENLPENSGNIVTWSTKEREFKIRFQRTVDEILNLLQSENTFYWSNYLGSETLCKVFNFAVSNNNQFISEQITSKFGWLRLSDRSLTSLPEGFHELKAVSQLDAGKNSLTAIPATIGGMLKLARLDFSENLLETIPVELGRLSELRELYLRANRLEAIPPEIGELVNLDRLSLSNNLLVTIPPEIGRLSELRELYLCANRLETIPPEIGRLQKLKRLDLSNNRNLTSLPLEILNLPRNCVVDLSGCSSLSQSVLNRLQRACSDQSYIGPRISISMTHENPLEEMREIEESLNRLLEIAGESFKYFTLKLPGMLTCLYNNEEEKNALKSWLSRLSFIGEYSAGGKSRKWLVENVLKYLSQACIDEAFTETFLTIIKGAAVTCGDRMALSVMYLSINYKLMTINKSDLKSFAELLIRGVWMIDLLQRCAQNKISTLPFFDEIEVYLAYPIKLKKELKLPIDIEGMRYFRISGVTEEDLAIAKFDILEKVKNREYVSFLVQDPRWLAALGNSLLFSNEYEGILAKKKEALENAETTEDYMKINLDYERNLGEVTNRALEGMDLS